MVLDTLYIIKISKTRFVVIENVNIFGIPSKMVCVLQLKLFSKIVYLANFKTFLRKFLYKTMLIFFCIGCNRPPKRKPKIGPLNIVIEGLKIGTLLQL